MKGLFGNLVLLYILLTIPAKIYAGWPGDATEVFYQVVGGPYDFDRSNASEGWSIDGNGKLDTVNFGMKLKGPFWKFNPHSAYCENGVWIVIDSMVIPYYTKSGIGKEIEDFSEIKSFPCPSDIKKEFNFGSMCLGN